MRLHTLLPDEIGWAILALGLLFVLWAFITETRQR